MPSLRQHPYFLELLEDRGIDLTQEALHTPERLEALTLQGPYWKLCLAHQDFSPATLQRLNRLAIARQALNWMHAMQAGERVNGVGARATAALHTAMRAGPSKEGSSKERTPKERAPWVEQIWKEAEAQRRKIAALLEHHPQFQTLVVLGIGGSQLGPEALYEALQPLYPSHRELLFIPNIDPQAHRTWRRKLDLERVLVAVISKSGTTLETAESEKWWRQEISNSGLVPSKRMISVTTPGSQLDRPTDFLECLYFDPSIGGRYSATSCVGALPLAFAFGMGAVEELLKGAAEMDVHALSDEQNLPLALACVAIWQRQLRQRPSQAVIAYRQCLHRFAAHLQQLEMESLGKSTDRSGKPLEGSCGALVMGEPGTCAQHSFFQWLHQGTDKVPVEFILETRPALTQSGELAMADQLLANGLAQSLALARGHKALEAYQTCPGGSPSSILACEYLGPAALGALLSLYEHKTAFEGFILGINPFDQEGVELGKRMARTLYEELARYRTTHTSDSWWARLV